MEGGLNTTDNDMPKRVGHLYEQLSDWSNIVDAEKVTTSGRLKNTGVARHVKNRWYNLVTLQHRIEDGSMRTDEYSHETRISGQDKIRDIAKLLFHPNHIWHRLLTMVPTPRMEKAMIYHTYASRKGKGQIKAALHLRDYLDAHKDDAIWYGQGDFIKYYDSMWHSFLRCAMERHIKDKRFMDAFMEPFERFSGNGKGIPLGINPSQLSGNVMLMPFDRYATQEVGCKGYLRYLDDFVFFGRTKEEVEEKMAMLESYVSSIGLSLHTPKIRRVDSGLDMLGYVYYGDGRMWWRESNKKKWLRRRKGVKNPKRRRDIDAAAWAMLKWCGWHGKELFEKVTGRRVAVKDGKYRLDMSIRLKDSGIRINERTDSEGRPFIDRPKIGMGMVIGKSVTVTRWIKGIRTSQGEGRYSLEVLFMGSYYKLIVNSVDIKHLVDEMERAGVTRFTTVFYDKGGLKYSYRDDDTAIDEMHGKAVEERDGKMVYASTGEEVELINNL